MSDFLDPYAAGSSPGLAPPPPPALRPPSQIKVFAILHLVFGGLGLVGTALGLLMQKFGNSALFYPDGANNPQAQLQRAIKEAGALHQNINYAVSVLLAVLLLIAGLKLLKRKSSGLAWSNAYAWLSITLKIVLAILFFTMVLPKLNGLLDGIVDEAVKSGGKKEIGTIVSVAKMTVIATGVVSPLLTCIYPILSLVFLNRKSVKLHLQ